MRRGAAAVFETAGGDLTCRAIDKDPSPEAGRHDDRPDAFPLPHHRRHRHGRHGRGLPRHRHDARARRPSRCCRPRARSESSTSVSPRPGRATRPTAAPRRQRSRSPPRWRRPEPSRGSSWARPATWHPRGEPGDKRADVWSFGVLLWERLTGRALFDGETVTDVIAAVSRLSVVPCYGFRGTSLINTTPCGATMASNFPSCSPRSF